MTAVQLRKTLRNISTTCLKLSMSPVPPASLADAADFLLCPRPIKSPAPYCAIGTTLTWLATIPRLNFNFSLLPTSLFES